MDNNLNLYHIFYTAAKLKNLSGAAKTLYISQPAVSKAVTKLEQSLNTILFVRSSRGVKLTPEGEILYRQLESAFESIRFGEEELARIHHLGIGRLSIGVSSTLCKYVLLPHLQEFIKRFPHIRISIECQSSYRTIEALEQGRTDIGIIGEPEHCRDISFYATEEIGDILVASKDYVENLKKRAGKENDPGRLLSQATMIMLDQENRTRQYFEHYLREENLSPDSIIEVSSMDLAVEFARIGLGIACVIEKAVQKEIESKTFIPFPLGRQIAPRKIGLAVGKQTDFNPAMNEFIRFFLN